MTIETRLSPGEAARELRISPQRLWQLACAGKVDAEQTPLGRLYRTEEIERVRAERAEAKRAKGA